MKLTYSDAIQQYTLEAIQELHDRLEKHLENIGFENVTKMAEAGWTLKYFTEYGPDGKMTLGVEFVAPPLDYEDTLW
jgi:hypothetical protein